jgi:hypothetical protein
MEAGTWSREAGGGYGRWLRAQAVHPTLELGHGRWIWGFLCSKIIFSGGQLNLATYENHFAQVVKFHL